jgi:hypothetical protein
MNLTELQFELRVFQDSLPRDKWISLAKNAIGDTLRKKSRDAIETSFRSGKDWYVWQGSERIASDKKSSTPVKPYSGNESLSSSHQSSAFST